MVTNVADIHLKCQDMRRLIALNGIKKSLEKIEGKMLELVSIDKEVRRSYVLITSVKSVGNYEVFSPLVQSLKR